jgi:tRNA A37 methylthiotransferase MiaB
MPIAQVIVASCSRRSLELEQVKSFLKGNGFEISKEDWRTDPEADLVLLSSCGFTQMAEDFGVSTYERICRTKKANATVVFGGCIPEINPERVRSIHNGATFSPQSYSNLDEIISAERGFATFRRPNVITRKSRTKLDIERLREVMSTFDGSLGSMQYIAGRVSKALSRRVFKDGADIDSKGIFYIQIQEGCSMKCSYCAIKTAIGPLRSRSKEDILDEFKNGIALGYRTFQLVGDNAGSYGLDRKIAFGELLTEIADIPGDFKLDLTDINPVYVSRIYDGIAYLLEKGKISSLYVPVQSGSQRILKLMRRECDMQKVRDRLINIRQDAPRGFKLGTSVIVGYPSETMDELNETIEYCRSIGFDWIWCHSFSARPDQPAAVAEGQLEPEEILYRARLFQSRLQHHTFVTTAETTAGNRTCQG